MKNKKLLKYLVIMIVVIVLVVAAAYINKYASKRVRRIRQKARKIK